MKPIVRREALKLARAIVRRPVLVYHKHGRTWCSDTTRAALVELQLETTTALSKCVNALTARWSHLNWRRYMMLHRRLKRIMYLIAQKDAPAPRSNVVVFTISSSGTGHPIE